MNAFSDPNLQRAYELGKREMRTSIKTKLLKRAIYLLKNVKSPESPMLLVATELKILASELPDFTGSTSKENKK